MSFRRVLFWTHLALGVSVGVVILLLAVTGALLSFEHQILRHAAYGHAEISPEAPRLSVPELAQAALDASAGRATALVVENDPTAPVTASAGRGVQLVLDPVSGAVLPGAPAWMTGAFDTVEALHRWLALEGVARDVARAVTGAANVAFLALLLSGIYLWWPRAWRWRLLRMQIWFRRGLPNAKARDYNWHHVLAFWALVPLLAISVSGMVLSYPTVRQALYSAYGEEPGRRRGPVQGGAVAAPELQAVFDAAAAEPGWNRLTLRLPAAEATNVSVEIDRGTGRRPAAKEEITYDLASARIVSRQGFADLTPATRAFLWMRFAHTGEYYGVIGQAVAGLASLAAALLVYTGLALSYRRLIRPLLRRVRVQT